MTPLDISMPAAERLPIVHNKLSYSLTTGQLREVLMLVPNDAPVFYQRIEYSYFTPGSGWGENAVLVSDLHTGDWSSTGQFIPAHGINVYLDKNGALGVYIQAHY